MDPFPSFDVPAVVLRVSMLTAPATLAADELGVFGGVGGTAAGVRPVLKRKTRLSHHSFSIPTFHVKGVRTGAECEREWKLVRRPWRSAMTKVAGWKEDGEEREMRNRWDSE